MPAKTHKPTLLAPSHSPPQGTMSQKGSGGAKHPHTEAVSHHPAHPRRQQRSGRALSQTRRLADKHSTGSLCCSQHGNAARISMGAQAHAASPTPPARIERLLDPNPRRARLQADATRAGPATGACGAPTHPSVQMPFLKYPLPSTFSTALEGAPFGYVDATRFLTIFIRSCRKALM